MTMTCGGSCWVSSAFRCLGADGTEKESLLSQLNSKPQLIVLVYAEAITYKSVQIFNPTALRQAKILCDMP